MRSKHFTLKSLLTVVFFLLTMAAFGQTVTPSGAFTYNYPIELPPGTNGMAPKLSLSYNSQGGNGMAGMGWTLTGFPVITRDTSYPVNWNNNDHFVYNGQRLIKDAYGIYHTEQENFQKIEYVANTYWVVTQKNGTKLFFGSTSDSKIEGVGKGAARVWALKKAIDVMGNFYTIDYSEDSANGDYYPVKITYTQGNGLSAYKEVFFDYEARSDHFAAYNPSKVDMDRRLKWITVKIGGNLLRKYRLDYLGQDKTKLTAIQEYGSDGVSTLPAVRFSWDEINRSFEKKSYDTRVVWKEGPMDTKLLYGDFNGDGKTDILMARGEADTSPVRYVFFIYLANGDGSYTKKYYDTKVVWKEGSIDTQLKLGDFNGDGKTDILMARGEADTSPVRYVFFTYLSKGDGTFSKGYYDTRVVWKEGPIDTQLKLGDFNGDGKTDILMIRGEGDTAPVRHVFFIYLANGDGTYTKKYYDTRVVWKEGSIDTQLKLGDFNGDGKTDILMARGEADTSPVRYVFFTYFSNGDGSFSKGYYDTRKVWKEGPIDTQLKLGDFNGDGKTDILMARGEADTSPVRYVFFTYFSNGNGSFSYGSYDTRVVWKEGPIDTQLKLGDFDGDGKTDILMARGEADTAPVRYVYFSYLSNGSGSFTKHYYDTQVVWKEGPIDTQLQLGDFNGDGKTDILKARGEADTSPVRYVFFTYQKREFETLTSITLPTGATITPSYTPATQVSGAVVPTDSSYPNITNKSGRRLVTALTVSDGKGQEYTSTYKYYNGKIRTGVRDERTMLGFEWMQTINPDGSSTKTWYYQEEEDALLAGAVKRQETFGRDGLLYSAAEFAYAKYQVQAANSSYHAVNFVRKTDEYGYRFNGASYTSWNSLKTSSNAVKTRVHYEYDTTYGNVIKVMNYGDLGTDGDDRLTVTEYINDDLFHITVPKSVKKYGYRLDETVFSGLQQSYNLGSHTEYYYDGYNTNLGVMYQKGLLTRKVDYSREAEQHKYPDISTTYTYDNFGNIKTITDGMGNTSTINYDTNYFTHVTNKINALGQAVETISYNNLMLPEWKKDINSHYTWYTYDVYGRETATSTGTEFGPVRALVSKVYSNTAAPGDYPKWIKEEVFTPSEGKPENYITSYTYFDNLGNRLQRKTEGLDENGNYGWIGVNYYENPETGETRVSEPAFTSSRGYSAVNWATTRKTTELTDAAGRVYSTTYPDGFTEYVKFGLRDKVSLTRGVDGVGAVSYEKVDGTNQTTYSYPKGSCAYADLATFNTENWEYRVTNQLAWNGSKIQEISKEDYSRGKSGNTLVTYLDGLGRKKSYDDPDMGLWNYEYDKNNNLAAQTDAKGNRTEFEYDPLNRISRKIGADTTIYTYDGTDGAVHGPDGLGRLTGLNYTDGSYSESYYYDDENKHYRITKTIDGKSRVSSTTRDELGRIMEEIYPDKEKVSYQYRIDGSTGSLKSSNGTAYISDLQYHITGQIKGYNLGNGGITTYNYDTNHKLTGINAYGPSGVIAYMQFNYDTFGNIIYKRFEDLHSFFTENYTYDGFFRLEKAVSNGLYGTKNYSYDSYNNITAKNGLSYHYNESVTEGGPHAVSEIKDDMGRTAKNYEYDANGNIIKITGQSHLIIRAKGTGVVHNPPRMELWLGGDKPEISWVVTSTEYQEYSWHGVIPQGATVDIVFANDNSDGGVDTNLIVDSIRANGIEVQSESVFASIDKGAYSAGCFDRVDVISGQEGINWTGALRFILPNEAWTPVRELFYDSENRMTGIKDNGMYVSTFVYDDGGQRIKKTEGGVTTYYFFDKYEEVYTRENGTESLVHSVKHYFANGQKIAYAETTADLHAELFYYHADHLGSAVRISDESGRIVQSMAYTPFGEVAWMAGEKGSNYTFTGQESDKNGFMYYNARYYDPELGRFLQADTMLDGLNRYTYCGNNPVMYNDPTGHLAWFVIPVIIGVVAGGITGGVVAHQKGIDLLSVEGIAHIATGALIGGLAGLGGAAVAQAGAAILGQGFVAGLVTSGLSGATGGFISGFGNSWAFGGEGTGLFQGDVNEALKNGGINALYGAATGMLLYGLVEGLGAIENLEIGDIIKDIEIFNHQGQSYTLGDAFSVIGEVGTKYPAIQRGIDSVTSTSMYWSSGLRWGIHYILPSLIPNAMQIINTTMMVAPEKMSAIKIPVPLDFMGGSIELPTLGHLLKHAMWHKKTKDKMKDEYDTKIDASWEW